MFFTNNRTSEIRNCTACWHLADYDSANTRYRNLGTSATGGSSLLLNEPGGAANPTRRTFSGSKYWWGSGVNGNNLSITAAKSLVDSIRFEAQYSADVWPPAGTVGLVGRGGGADPARVAEIVLPGSATPQFNYHPNGTSASLATANATTTLASSSGAVAVEWDGADVTFYSATTMDGPWVQLGDVVPFAQADFTGTDNNVTRIGCRYTGGGTWLGKIYRASITIEGDKIVEINFANAGVTQTSITNSGTVGGSVAINRSAAGTLQGAVVDGETRAFGKLDGSDDYVSVTDDALLDLVAAQSGSWFVLHRTHTTQTDKALLAKRAGLANTDIGYSLVTSGSSTPVVEVADGTTETNATAAAWSAAALTLSSSVRSVAADTITAYTNGTAGTPVTDATTATLENASNLRLGRLSGAGTAYYTGEITAAGVARRVLTANDLKRLKAELMVY